MAIPKSAKIFEARDLNLETRLLTLSMQNKEDLHFMGGQYIIVNTNIPLPGNKIAKRAYSILSSDQNQNSFNICVRKIGEGPGSNYMHYAPVGSDIQFSGPWGQFAPDENSLSCSSALVVATDTGITAALGLVQGHKFKDHFKECSLIWMRESADYFIPEDWIKNLLVKDSIDFRSCAIPPVNDMGRLGFGLASLKTALESRVPDQIFLSGDGALLYPFKEEAKQKGFIDSKIKMECFFNNPFKKIGA